MNQFKSFTSLKKKLLVDPDVKQAYDALESKYQLIQTIIDKRLKAKMSQKDLAKKVGTGQSAISRLESGTYNPSLKFLTKIATALNTKLTISLE